VPTRLGNRNATRHGVYGFLAIGSLPKGASYVRRLLGQFERHLREAVQEREGEIRTYHAALIQTACRHEGRAQLLTRWIREADDKLKLTDKVAVLKEIGAASDSRDKCLERLGLNEIASRNDIHSIMQSIYNAPRSPQPPAVERSPSPPNDTCNSQTRDNEQASGPDDDIPPLPADDTN